MQKHERQKLGRLIDVLHTVAGEQSKPYDVSDSTDDEIFEYLSVCIKYRMFDLECYLRDMLKLMKLNDKLAKMIHDEGEQNDGGI